jgi:hypothetical protein
MVGNPDENEKEAGGRPAFLFEAGDLSAVTLDPGGADLPPPPAGSAWRLVRGFMLGVRDAGIEGINPEPIIRAVHARGVHVWRRSDPSLMEGTSQ